MVERVSDGHYRRSRGASRADRWTPCAGRSDRSPRPIGQRVGTINPRASARPGSRIAGTDLKQELAMGASRARRQNDPYRPSADSVASVVHRSLAGQDRAVASPADARPPGDSSASATLALQRSAGNSAVSTLLGSPPVVQRAGIQIDEIASSVRQVDGDSALPRQSLAQIVRLVMSRMQEEHDRKQQAQQERELSQSDSGDASATSEAPAAAPDADEDADE
jgi:hypothetical protein